MAIGNVPPLAYLHPSALPALTVLWHDHPIAYPSTGFHSTATSRFAASAKVFAQPPRSMYYAGESAACALWECSLRAVFGDADGIVHLHPKQFVGRRLSAIQNTRPLQHLDLSPAGLRRLAGSEPVASAWHELTCTPRHNATHAPVNALLAQADVAGVVVDGLSWFSRQCGGADGHPRAFVFYDPPLTTRAFLAATGHAPVDLAVGAAGWAPIDAALEFAGLRRAGGSAKIYKLIAEDPPDWKPL